MDQPTPPPSEITPEPPPPNPPRVPSATHVSPFGALCSYLVPGLGQILQGRIAKGLLFFVCVYILFFYGLYLGAAEVRVDQRTYRMSSNVYLPTTRPEQPNTSRLRQLPDALYNRPQFLGQFWIGILAWPAIVQYWSIDYDREQELHRQIDILYEAIERDGADTDLGRRHLEEIRTLEQERQHPTFGDFMREPSQRTINAVHNGTDKRLELAWVFTVIAGVLNIMVIYDAYAGPAHPARDEKDSPEPPGKE
jgi:hypothetical protein